MSVAEILQEMARNAGRAQLQRGALIGGTIADVSQVPAQIMADRQKAALLAREQARQDATLRFASNADARATSDQSMQDRANAVATAKANALKVGIAAGFGDDPDPKNFNEAKAIQAVTAAGFPELATNISETHRNLLPKLTSGAPGSVMRNETTGQVVPGSEIPDKKPDYTINGQRFSGDGTPMGEPVPTQAAPKGYQHVDKLLDGKPATLLIAPAPGGKVYDLSGAEIPNAGQRIKPIPAASVTIHNDNAKVPTLPTWALDDSRPTGPEGNKLDPTVRMTPNGLFQAAQTYIATGQFPPTARGSDPIAQNTRAAITSKVGAISASSGMDEPALRAFYKSNAASLGQQQKMQDSVQGFMATADKNAALLQESLKKIPDIGIPVFNKPLRSFVQNVAGNKDLSQFATYLQSVQNEYARIISQPNLAGQLTDSARHEAEALLDPKATVPQILASVDALQKEGNNRLVSVGEQIKRIQGRMQNVPAAAAQTSGVIYAKDPQGNVHQAAAGTALPAGWVQVEKR